MTLRGGPLTLPERVAVIEEQLRVQANQRIASPADVRTEFGAKGELLVGAGDGTVGVLEPGAIGTALFSDPSADLGLAWESPDQLGTALFKAKGDLIVGLSAGVPATLAVGSASDVLIADPGGLLGVQWGPVPSGGSPGGAAGGDLTGTYPNPTIANSAITSAKIADGTIVDADVSGAAAIAISKIVTTTLAHLAGIETFTGAKSFSAAVTLTDGTNVVLGTTTGSQIGTTSAQKLGVLGATPVLQQTSGTPRDVLIAFGFATSGVTEPGGITGFATPAIVHGTAAAAGAATTTIRSDATIVTFDATAPTTIAFGDAAGTGVEALAARRDHRHGMPAVIAGGTDVLAGLVTQGLRAASSNPPMDLGSGALSAGQANLGGNLVFTASGKQIQMPFTSGNVGLISSSTTTMVFRGGTSGWGFVNNANTQTIIGVTDAGLWTYLDGSNLAFGTTTGTKIGTSTTQKIGLWNTAPAVQPAAATELLTGLASWGAIAAAGSAPITTTGTVGVGAFSSTSITATGTVALTDTLTVTDAKNIVLGTTTGTQLGTGTTQKLGFLGATPVAQQANSVDLAVVMSNFGLRASGGNPPLNLGSGALTAGASTLGATTVTGFQSSGGNFQVDSSGRVGFAGTAPVTDRLMVANGNHPGSGASQIGYHVDTVQQAANTTQWQPFVARIRTVASLAMTTAIGYTLSVPSLGASSTVGTIRGIDIANQGSASVSAVEGIYVEGQTGSTSSGYGIRVDAAKTTALWIGSTTTSTDVTGGIAFGSGRDVSLYRSGSSALRTNSAFTVDGALTVSGATATFADALNFVLGTTTGTKIGTGTTQKIGFWNAAPIVQPTTAVAAATFVANTSLIANDTATWDGYTVGQVVKALRNEGLLA